MTAHFRIPECARYLYPGSACIASLRLETIFSKAPSTHEKEDGRESGAEPHREEFVEGDTLEH